MSHHFFIDQKEPVLPTINTNKLNGKSTERYFAGLLSIALNARVSFASRTEDDAKVDLVTIMSHPWEENEVEVMITQVKSGPSYCRIDDNKLFVNQSKFQDLLKRNHNSLICWTRVDEDMPHWFLIRNNAKFLRGEYNRSHVFSPLTKFDLMRILSSINSKDGGKGLIFSRANGRYEYKYEDLHTLRNRAKKQYAKLKGIMVIHPLFGPVEFTRLGWRHITRSSRFNPFKVASYEIIQILHKIITLSPTRHYIKNADKSEDTRYHYREIEFILIYDNVKVRDRETDQIVPVNVYIKLVEVCRYEKNWISTPASAMKVARRVIFRSIYYKEKSSQNMHA